MLPPKTDPRWAALLTGSLDHKFANAAASMLVFRLKMNLRTDNTPAARERSIDELQRFFAKYENILGTEIAAIFRK